MNLNAQETAAAQAETGGAFALGWIQRLLQLQTSQRVEDNNARFGSVDYASKIAQWRDLAAGIAAGNVTVGSRNPVHGVPPWVTPVVLQGGFVQPNAFRAGGHLQPHEIALAEVVGVGHALSDSDEADPGPLRSALNQFFFDDPRGVAVLAELVENGCYRLAVPEEGAALVAAWLASHEHENDAIQLTATLRPWFSILRFYPIPSDTPVEFTSSVSVCSVSDVLKALATIQTPALIALTKEVFENWLPLYDALLGLFAETFEPGITVELAVEDGKTGRAAPQSSWPCAYYSQDWRQRAAEVISQHDALQKQVAHAPVRFSRKGHHATLVKIARKIADHGPDALSGGEVGAVRMILARAHTKHGLPGSAEHNAFRVKQRPSYVAFAKVLQDRLQKLQPQYDEGLDFTITSNAAVLSNADPVNDLGLSAASAATLYPPKKSLEQSYDDAAIPPSVLAKVLRAAKDDLSNLVRPAKYVLPGGSSVERTATVTSAEMLASVIPQLSASVRSAGIADAGLRRLSAANYAVFKTGRSSLLLLNLEHQVRVSELPWMHYVDAIQAEYTRFGGVNRNELARTVFSQVANVCLRSFPQTIIPNKLLQEFSTLAQEMTAGKLPAEAAAAATNIDANYFVRWGPDMARLVRCAAENGSAAASSAVEKVIDWSSNQFEYPYPMPLVNEVAVDIFQHAFTPKFVRAAREASVLLDFPGALYSRYYGLEGNILARVGDLIPAQNRSYEQADSPSKKFYKLCAELAHYTGNRYGAAANGTVVEQEQILTTHNLAVLFLWLPDLLPSLGWACIENLPRKCFQFVLHERAINADMDWRAKLASNNNSAYAWRQMVFFLTLLQLRDLDEGTRDASESLAQFRAWAEVALAELSFKDSAIATDISSLLNILFERLESPNCRSAPFLGWVSK